MKKKHTILDLRTVEAIEAYHKRELTLKEKLRLAEQRAKSWEAEAMDYRIGEIRRVLRNAP